MTKGNFTRRRRFTAAIAVLGAGIAALTLAPSAFAIGFSSVNAAPASTAAGANSNFTLDITFSNAGDDIRNLTISLPPGQVGDPNATPKCPIASLLADSCDPATAVGSVTTNLNAIVVVAPVPISAPGTLYNVPAQPGEPARFGIVLRPFGGLLGKVVLQSAVKLRSDFGLDTLITEIPRTAPPVIPGVDLPIDITSMQVTLFGQVGGRGFVRNPTSCVPAVTRFKAVSYDGATNTDGTAATALDSYTPTDCASLPFSPTFSARAGGPGRTSQNTNPSVTTAIDQDVGEAGLRTATVVTPIDFAPNNAALINPCAPGDFATGSCGPASTVGTALATSPLLTQPLTSPVILVANPVGLPDIGLDLRGELAFKLRGTLGFNNQVTFDSLPDIPIGHFELSFSGGPGGLLFAARDLCQPPAPNFTGNFTAHSGASLPFASAATIEGCGGGTAGAKAGDAGNKCVKKKVKRKKKNAAKSKAVAAKKKKKRRACGKKKRKKKKR